MGILRLFHHMDPAIQNAQGNKGIPLLQRTRDKWKDTLFFQDAGRMSNQRGMYGIISFNIFLFMNLIGLLYN